MNSLASTVSPSQGLHFIITDHVPSIKLSRDCSLHILHNFPSDVFLDPYELEQRVLDNVAPTFKVWGETDLELPVSAVSEGSLLLLGPVPPGSKVDVPIHARYPLPSWNASHVSITLQDPLLLTVCSNHGDNTVRRRDIEKLFSPYLSPFDMDSVNIGLVPFKSSGLSIRIPTGDQSHLSIIEPLTVIAVFAAVIYMGFAFWKAASHFNSASKVKDD